MSDNRIQRVAQPLARRGAVLLGRVAPGLHMTPDILICGAQRCGTTSMYQALRRHPNILRPTLAKGVHYFDTDHGRGMNWYRAHFPFRAQAALVERRTGHRAATFESSPYYLFHPLAAGRIAGDLPGVRILILLRDPVERAYSAHAHEFARGFEIEPFAKALELEDVRLAGEEEKIVADPSYRSHAHQHQAYVRRGFYVEQVRRMVDEIGAERVHVIDAEDFFTDPEPVWRDVTKFLALPDAPAPAFAQHNSRPRSPMPASLRQELTDAYEDSDRELAQWWGRTPSWRR